MGITKPTTMEPPKSSRKSRCWNARNACRWAKNEDMETSIGEGELAGSGGLLAAAGAEARFLSLSASAELLLQVLVFCLLKLLIAVCVKLLAQPLVEG